jgi:ornithine cyclodeaminase
MNIPFISSDFVNLHTDYSELIAEIRLYFSSVKVDVPLRTHHNFPTDNPTLTNTLLLMPAWEKGGSAGVKIVTVHPENNTKSIPTIQGVYLFLDADTGLVKALIDAKSLTNKRTAASSALASSYLSKKNASSLLMIGTGALAPELIQAHCSVRPISKVYVYGRNVHKAHALVDNYKSSSFSMEVVEDLYAMMPEVDIISCATLSKAPLVKGAYVTPGTHVDLVGAYKPDMRESDSELIVNAELYLDTMEAGMIESGDIAIPLDAGLITKDDIRGDLFSLCQINATVRKDDQQITLFKSVGHAIEDLAAANYYYEIHKKQLG